MPLSFVLRVIAESLVSGSLVGQVEDVVSGGTATFRNHDELLRALQAFSPHLEEPI